MKRTRTARVLGFHAFLPVAVNHIARAEIFLTSLFCTVPFSPVWFLIRVGCLTKRASLVCAQVGVPVVYAPRYPQVKTEGWWLVLGNPAKNELVAIKRIVMKKNTVGALSLLIGPLGCLWTWLGADVIDDSPDARTVDDTSSY